MAMMIDSVDTSWENNLDLNAFIHAVEGLSRATEDSAKDLRIYEERLQSAQESAKRQAALLDGLQGLFGVSSIRIEQADPEGIIIHASIGKCPTMLTLDSSNALTDIKVKTADTNIDDRAILSEASKLAPPNDIRQAVLLISAAQSSKDALKQHITEQRKHSLISVKDSLTFDVGLQNGMLFAVRAHTCYPLVPGGICVESVSSTDSNRLRDTAWLSSVQIACNSQCFYTLPQLCNYIDHNFGAA